MFLKWTENACRWVRGALRLTRWNFQPCAKIQQIIWSLLYNAFFSVASSNNQLWWLVEAGVGYSNIHMSYGILVNSLFTKLRVFSIIFCLMSGFISCSSSCAFVLMKRLSAASVTSDGPSDHVRALVQTISLFILPWWRWQQVYPNHSSY